jgi:phosphatidylserine/phosphatidylglycerophosphate/cardiolipin synthase-like enzyme
VNKTKLLLINIIFIFSSNATGRSFVLFSPSGKIASNLIKQLKNSKHRIYGAVYMLTDKRIATALIAAKERNVDVQIVTDQITATSQFGKCKPLAEALIPVFVFSPTEKKTKKNYEDENKDLEKAAFWCTDSIMHNKFAIIDDQVVTGSFNWTVAADAKNRENLLITNDEEVVEQFLEEFEKLKKESTLYGINHKIDPPAQTSSPEIVPTQAAFLELVPVLPKPTTGPRINPRDTGN